MRIASTVVGGLAAMVSSGAIAYVLVRRRRHKAVDYELRRILNEHGWFVAPDGLSEEITAGGSAARARQNASVRISAPRAAGVLRPGDRIEATVEDDEVVNLVVVSNDEADGVRLPSDSPPEADR